MGLGAPAASLFPFVRGPLTDVISRRIFSFQRSQEETFLLACIREKTGILTTLLVQIIFDFFQNALLPLVDGLLRHPQSLCAFPFGVVFKVKFIDQLIVFRRKQIQNINGRAVPELNTTLNSFYGFPPKPMGLGSYEGNQIAVYPINDHAGEQIARQMCMLYDMRIGFSTWGMNKAEMSKALAIGCVTEAQNIGKAFLAAKEKHTDLMDELKKVMTVREFCRGTIEKLDLKQEGGFDFGTTVVKGDDGHKYFIDFKNENLILRDEKGKTIMTAPEGIGLVDLDTLTPLTNADTKEGMKLLVTMTPAHPNWWDEDHKAYTCWLPELERVGMKGKQVRF